MDPKSTVQQHPPATPEADEPQIEVWVPAFERWQRITEALISGAGRASDLVTNIPRLPRM
jgi:hypothetical protein